MKQLFLVIFISLLSFSIAGAQSFTAITAGDVVTDGKGSRSANFLDLNNDGWDDVLITNFNNPSHIYLNNRTGFVKTTLDFPLKISFIKIADLNDDGKQDLVISRYGSETQVWVQ